MRLSVTDPDRSFYDYSTCKLPSGCYLVVTSDCIFLEFDAKSQPFSFEHVCEVVPAVNVKRLQGSLVVGEQARRKMRHALVPDDPVAVSEQTLRSVELALSCLFPVGDSAESDGAVSEASATTSIRKLLELVWRVDAAALPLAESLLKAYQTTQVKPIKERQRRAACAVRLTKYITTWRAPKPETVSLYEECKLEVEKERAAAAAAAQGGAGANADAEEDTGGGRARPPNSRCRKRGQARKVNVKPGDKPAFNIPRPLLQPYMQVLDSNDVDHICRMGLAFTLDPVVASIKVRHFGGLEDLCSVLRSGNPRYGIEMVVGEATSRDCERAAKSRSTICLLR